MLFVGIIEEFAKLLVPLVIFLVLRPRDPRGGVVVGVASGMGFATWRRWGTASRSSCGPAASPPWTRSCCCAGCSPRLPHRLDRHDRRDAVAHPLGAAPRPGRVGVPRRPTSWPSRCTRRGTPQQRPRPPRRRRRRARRAVRSFLVKAHRRPPLSRPRRPRGRRGAGSFTRARTVRATHVVAEPFTAPASAVHDRSGARSGAPRRGRSGAAARSRSASAGRASRRTASGRAARSCAARVQPPLVGLVPAQQVQLPVPGEDGAAAQPQAAERARPRRRVPPAR